jgi:hypothetical protein
MKKLARRCIAAKKDLHPPCILMAVSGGFEPPQKVSKTSMLAITSGDIKKNKAHLAVQFNVLDRQTTSQIVLRVAVASLHAGSGCGN